MELSQDTTQQPQLPVEFKTADESMWSAFQNILTFISLAFFAGSLHTLWGFFVNYWLPVESTTYISSNTYWLNNAIAALVVSTPFFIFLFLVTNNKYILQPELKKNVIKKRLNYLTLIITFIILLIRAISAVNTALNNEFTVNFALNLLVTVVITGTIFSYYLYEVRFEKQTGSFWWYMAGSIMMAIIAIATLGGGIYVRNNILANTRNQIPFPKFNSIKPIVTPSLVETEKLLATAVNLPSESHTVQGIDITVTGARAYEKDGTKFLEVSLIFEAAKPCPLTGGAVCGVTGIGIQAKDSEGFKISRILIGNQDSIRDTVLRQGDKIRGKAYFSLADVSKSYSVFYTAPSGETSGDIVLNLQ